MDRPWMRGSNGGDFHKSRRLGRLDVVMTIDNEARAFGGFRARGFGNDDGMAGGRAKAGLEAEAAAMAHQPFGAGFEVPAMLWLGGDAGKADVFNQFADEAGLVVLQILDDFLHFTTTTAAWTGGTAD